MQVPLVLLTYLLACKGLPDVTLAQQPVHELGLLLPLIICGGDTTPVSDVEENVGNPHATPCST